MHLYLQIRKYLLWLAILGLVVLGSHVVLLYMYHDAKSYPIEGGTLHVGLIGENASIDLLAYDPRSSGNETNDMLIHFLYRGILSYDLKSRKIVEDLGNCGIDQFPNFRCTLNANALWHDGSPIEIEDVLATYDFYTTSAKNPGFQSRLEKLQVYEDTGEIVFEFATSDITTLNLLFLPILKKEDIGQFEEQYAFSQNAFSGAYVFEDRRFDEQMGVTQILLSRNPIYGDIKDTYIQHIVLSFFTDAESLRQNEGRLHVSLYGENMVEDVDQSGAYRYQRPQYFSAFLHSARLPLSIREVLVQDVFPKLSLSSDENFSHMDTIFFDVPKAEQGDVSPTPSFKKVLSSLGYRLGSDSIFSEVSSDVVVSEVEPDETEKLVYLRTPTTDPVLYTTQDFLIFEGSFPASATAVRVNDYTLQSFEPSEGKFVYRATPEFGNLSVGKNVYVVSFFDANEKQLDTETITVYYAESQTELSSYRSENEISENVSVVSEELPSDASSGTSGLDPHVYHDASGEPLTFVVAYIGGSDFLETYAQNLRARLISEGVLVELFALTGEDLSGLATQEGIEYDILLTGIHLGIFDYNVFPFYHSGQAKAGQNFSRLRNLELDGLLEQLRDGVYYSNPDRLRQLQKDILTILDTQHVVYPLVSPFEYIVYDPGISGVQTPAFLPSTAYVPHVFAHSSLNQGFEAIPTGKGVRGFFRWIFNPTHK